MREYSIKIVFSDGTPTVTKNNISAYAFKNEIKKWTKTHMLTYMYRENETDYYSAEPKEE